jgi:hypothetical protein
VDAASLVTPTAGLIKVAPEGWKDFVDVAGHGRDLVVSAWNWATSW